MELDVWGRLATVLGCHTRGGAAAAGPQLHQGNSSQDQQQVTVAMRQYRLKIARTQNGVLSEKVSLIHIFRRSERQLWWVSGPDMTQGWPDHDHSPQLTFCHWCPQNELNFTILAGQFSLHLSIFLNIDKNNSFQPHRKTIVFYNLAKNYPACIVYLIAYSESTSRFTFF